MNTFEKIIQEFIEKTCKTDEVLAKKYEDSGKDIAGCCRYIKSEARKKAQNGCAVIEDAQVFGWAVHYFDEGLKAPADSPEAEVKVSSSAKVENTPKKAVSVANNKPKAKKGSDDSMMMSLFDFGEE